MLTGHARPERRSRSSSTTARSTPSSCASPTSRVGSIGKRVTGHFFCDEVLAGGGAIEACVYLLAVDVDMTPLPGYEFANWATGYGDFRCVPDFATLRRHPVAREDRARALRPRRRRRPASRSRCRPGGSCSARSSGPRRSATG